MKLPVSKTNAPVWRDITVKSVLPRGIETSRNPLTQPVVGMEQRSQNLFRDLDADLWRATGENPVMLLQQLSTSALKKS